MNSKSTLSPIIIRSFQQSDLSGCQKVLQESQREYDNPTIFVEHAFQTDMADIEKNYFQIPNGHWWVAVSADNNQVVGQVAVLPLKLGNPMIYRETSIEERDYICELDHMSVAKDVQRTGIGTKLILTLMDFARQHGFRQVHLTTLCNMKKACAFYEKHGFVRGKIEKISSDETIIKKRLEPDDNDHNCPTFTSVIFEVGEPIPDEDKRLMELPPTQSNYLYTQHFWRIL